MSSDARTYVAANLPGWIAAGVLAWIAAASFGVPPWIAAAGAGMWVLKDLLLYPYMRHFYRPQPPEARMIGERGVVLQPLAPRGLVRVRGEIWQAQTTGDALPEGFAVRVTAVDGLLLTVDMDG